LSFAAGSDWSPPRGPDGKPDFNGIWSNSSVTRIVRPPGVTKLVVSREEAETIVNANPFQQWIRSEDRPSNIDDDLLKDKNTDAEFNAFWFEQGDFLAKVKGEYRTSWIVEPDDGRVPYSADAKKHMAAARAENQQRLFQGPEALPLYERCLVGVGFPGGPGMLNPPYNSNYQIVQTPQTVMIVVEMVHDARIIRLFKDRKTAQASHGPPQLELWFGDSVGWWEGDTLAVEIANVNPRQGAAGPLYLSEKGKVTERFTRVSPTEILYEFEVEDPAFYTQPWHVEQTLNKIKGPIYEFACHEGNYGMENILRGARSEDARGTQLSSYPGTLPHAQ
jgi:hypothetical protein